MKKTELFTVLGKTTRLTSYNEVTEIKAYLESKDWFHDGTVESISHDKECTQIGFKHYNDPEYTIQRLIFTGNVELTMNLDLLVRHIYEITFEENQKTTVCFEGTAIEIQSDQVMLQIQELVS